MPHQLNHFDASGGLIGQPARQPDGAAPLEWSAAILGALLAVMSIGYMSYEALVGDDSPPELSLVLDSSHEVGGGLYLGRISVQNHGGKAVARLRVEGVIDNGSGRIERSEAIFDAVPSHAKRQGALFFTQDPTVHPPRLRAIAHEEP